jgi:hypothetical protein
MAVVNQGGLSSLIQIIMLGIVSLAKARNICNKLILNANTKYYSSISEKIHTETTGSKNWWNLIKSLLGDSNYRSIPPIQTDDDITMMQFASK